MNKIIFKILIGSLLIAIIVLWGGQQFYYMKQTKYRQQLEYTINNKCLEGKYSIGAFYYNEKDSTSVYKVSDYDFGDYIRQYPKSCGNKLLSFSERYLQNLGYSDVLV